MDPQVGGTRQNALGECQNAFHVEIIEAVLVLVDACKGQLLAQPVALPVVRFDVDRSLEEKRFGEPIQLRLDALDAAFRLSHLLGDGRSFFLPHAEHGVLHQAHVGGGRLKALQLLGEQSFERRLCDVDGAADAAAAVVVRVPLPHRAFGPTRSQSATACLTPDEGTKRKLGLLPEMRTDRHDSTRQNALNPIESPFGNKRLEVAALFGDTKLRRIQHRDVHGVAQNAVQHLLHERPTMPPSKSA